MKKTQSQNKENNFISRKAK